MERFWVRADGGEVGLFADMDLGQWLGGDPKRLLVASVVPASCFEEGQAGIAVCFLETDDVFGVASTMGPGNIGPDKWLEVWGIRESGEVLEGGGTAEDTLRAWLEEAGYVPAADQEKETRYIYFVSFAWKKRGFSSMEIGFGEPITRIEQLREWERDLGKSFPDEEVTALHFYLLRKE